MKLFVPEFPTASISDGSVPEKIDVFPCRLSTVLPV
jgi:hypothetical protein